MPDLRPAFGIQRLTPGRAARLVALSIALSILLAGTAWTAAGASDAVVRISTAWSVEQARPGDRVLLAVIADIERGFHINADAAQLLADGDFSPVPTRLGIVETAPGVSVTSVRFPPARAAKVAFAENPLMLFEGRAVIYLTVDLDPGLSPGIHPLEMVFAYQACDDQSCRLPVEATLSEGLRVAAAGTAAVPANREIFSAYAETSPPRGPESLAFDLFGWRFSLPTMSGAGLVLLLATAGLGGALLNFTPCVLPLVPIKIISLSRVAENDRRRSLVLGTAMFAGVLGFWVLLGAMIAGVTGFTATNQLFHYPAFTILVGLVIAGMALGMFGAFHTRLPAFLYLFNPDQETLAGSFGLGILTAVLSTPCTAPFMGAAAAWAVTQPPAVTLLTFAVIGGGMAFPYLLLAAFPELVRRLPRSGPGSALLKEVMGFMLLAAAAYFVGSGVSALLVDPPDPPGKAYWWAVAAFGAGGGAWLTIRILKVGVGTGVRVLFALVGLTMISGTLVAAARLSNPGPIDWVHYTPRRLEAALAEGKPVVMVFTAEWCLNCKFLEQGVLHDPRVAALAAGGQAVFVKVDITGSNSDGRAMLRQAGSLTIPLLAVWSPEGDLAFKSDFYTVEQVLAAVAAARRPNAAARP